MNDLHNTLLEKQNKTMSTSTSKANFRLSTQSQPELAIDGFFSKKRKLRIKI